VCLTTVKARQCDVTERRDGGCREKAENIQPYLLSFFVVVGHGVNSRE
jgi:hypothetical protein